MAFLLVEKGNSEDLGKVFPLPRNTVIIGRTARGNRPDIAINDDYISRRHAEICYREGDFLLHDLGSTNKTSLDGVVVEPNKSYTLVNDVVIGLGITLSGPRVVLRFKESDETKKSVAVPAIVYSNSGAVPWLNIDEGKQEILVDEMPVPLSKKEYFLILLLYRKAGRVCSRDEIIAAVWPDVQDGSIISTAAIDQLVHRLRQKVEPDPARPSRIISKKAFGYMLV